MNDSEKMQRRQYLEYLMWAQGGGKIPDKTYVDWTGATVFSYEDWLINLNKETAPVKIEHKITELKGRLEVLEIERNDVVEKLRNENKYQLLPILQKFATCHWSPNGNVRVVFTDPEPEKQVLSIVTGDSWPFGGNVEIDEFTNLCFDDDELTLRFCFSGTNQEMDDKTVDHLFKLKLKVSFVKIIRETEDELSHYKNQLNRFMEYEFKFGNRT